MCQSSLVHFSKGIFSRCSTPDLHILAGRSALIDSIVPSMKSASKLNSTFDDDEGKGDFDQSEQVSRLLQMPAGVSEHCSVVI